MMIASRSEVGEAALPEPRRRVSALWRDDPSRKQERKIDAATALPLAPVAPQGCVALCAPVLRTPLPRRAGMRRAEGVFPKHREDETPTHRSQPWPNFAA